ncbi:MAG: hypothetical protein ACOZIN_01050 [Myxococcota bacterium]
MSRPSSRATFWVSFAVVALLGGAIFGVLKSQGTPTAAKPASQLGGLGRVSIQSRPSAQLFFEQKLLGKTPLVDLYMPAGRQQFVLVGTDGLRRSLTIDVAPDRVTKVSVDLGQLAPAP